MYIKQIRGEWRSWPIAGVQLPGLTTQISGECGVLAKTPSSVGTVWKRCYVDVTLRRIAEGDKPGLNPGLAAVDIRRAV